MIYDYHISSSRLILIFILSLLLGEGAYGEVYRATDLHTNKEVAMKKVRLEVEDEGFPTTSLREVPLFSF